MDLHCVTNTSRILIDASEPTCKQNFLTDVNNLQTVKQCSIKERLV